MPGMVCPPGWFCMVKVVYTMLATVMSRQNRLTLSP
jgi:hypothetical protein